tara:strand:+ start:508 stop:777 length:270 start_codon:yes stop_codon:yes gene_type:complete
MEIGDITRYIGASAEQRRNSVDLDYISHAPAGRTAVGWLLIDVPSRRAFWGKGCRDVRDAVVKTRDMKQVVKWQMQQEPSKAPGYPIQQ